MGYQRRTDEDRKKKREAYRAAVAKELTVVNIEPRRPGRPETYTPELGQLVCKLMMEHGSLAEACRRDDRLPDRHTVWDWSQRHPEFDAALTQSRERLMDKWADDLISIADDDALEPNDRRIRIETRRWLMSKLAYRRYGDKLIHSGDPDNPLQILHKSVSIDALSVGELEALEQFTTARLQAIDAEFVEMPKNEAESMASTESAEAGLPPEGSDGDG